MKERPKRLFNAVSCISQNGRLFSDVEETIVFQRINGVDFNFSGYQSKEACRDFMNSTLDYFFEHEIGCKLKVINSVGILCDCSTEKVWWDKRQPIQGNHTLGCQCLFFLILLFVS